MKISPHLCHWFKGDSANGGALLACIGDGRVLDRLPSLPSRRRREHFDDLLASKVARSDHKDGVGSSQGAHRCDVCVTQSTVRIKSNGIERSLVKKKLRRGKKKKLNNTTTSFDILVP